MGSPAQSRSRAAQSIFSPLSVTREREKTDEGEAQTETEAPERPLRRVASRVGVKDEGEGEAMARASQRSPEEARRQGETQGKSRRRSLRAACDQVNLAIKLTRSVKSASTIMSP